MSPPSATPDGGGELIDGRYRVVSRLGATASSEVLRVVDEQEGGRVLALKIAALDDPELSRRLRLEFAATRTFRHPAIVGAHDLAVVARGDRAGRTYLTLDLVEGADAVTALRGASLGDVVAVAARLFDALAAMHAAGFVHGDLKPANLLVGRDGAGRAIATLIDLGLVGRERGLTGWLDRLATTGDADEAEPGAAAGTPLYVAPERIVGGPFDRRADLYSAGALLYECLTGEPPFLASSVGEVLRLHLDAPPRRPSERGAADAPLAASGATDAVRTAIDELILRLLAKDPADRFEGAAAAMTALLALPELGAGVDTGVGAFEEAGSAASAAPLEPPFVGRERLIASALDALDGATVLITAGPGFGKSRLAGELLARVAVGGARGVLVRAAREREPSAILTRLAERVATLADPALAGRMRAAIAALADDGAAAAPAPGAEKARAPAIERLVRLVRAAPGRFVVVVDDAGALSDAAYDLVAALAGERVGFVLVGVPSDGVDALTRRLGAGRVVPLALERLGDAEAARLLRGLGLGDDAALESARRAAGGVPALLVATARAHGAEGDDALEASLDTRLEALGASAVAVLGLVHAARTGAPLGAVERVATAVLDVDPTPALASLLGRGLLVIDDDDGARRVRQTVPALGARALERLDAGAVAAAWLAEALRSFEPPDSLDDPPPAFGTRAAGEVAAQLPAVGDEQRRRAAPRALIAARALVARFAYAEAGPLYDAIAAATDDPAVAAAAREEGGFVAAVTGRTGDALERLEDARARLRARAVDRALPAPLAGRSVVALARTCRRLGLVHERRGEGDRALEALEEGARALAALLSDEAAGLPGPLLAEARLEEAEGRLRVAFARYARGEGDRALETADVVLASEAAARDGRPRALALCARGLVHLGAGRFGEAASAFRESLASAERAGLEADVPVVLTNLGAALLRTGEEREALVHLERSVALLREVGEPAQLARAINNTAAVLAGRGDRRRARRLLREARALHERLGDARAAAEAASSLATLLADDGRLRAALLWARRARAAAEAAGEGGGDLGSTAAWAALAEAGALLEIGRLPRARQALRASAPLVEDASDAGLELWLSLHRAELARLRGDAAGARRAAKRARRIAEQAEHARGGVLARIALARVALDDERLGPARRLLAEARTRAAELGRAGAEALAEAAALAAAVEARGGAADRGVELATEAAAALGVRGTDLASRIARRRRGAPRLLALVAAGLGDALAARGDADGARRAFEAAARQHARIATRLGPHARAYDADPRRASIARRIAGLAQRTSTAALPARAPAPAAASAVSAPPPGAAPGSVSGGGNADGVRSAHRLALLVELARALATEDDVDRLLERLLDTAIDVLGAERGFLVLRRGNRDVIEVARGLGGEALNPSARRVSRRVCAAVLESGEPVLLVDALAGAGAGDAGGALASSSLRDLRARAVLCVPLRRDDAVEGALYLDNRLVPGAFGDEERRLAEALADLAVVARASAERAALAERRRVEAERERARSEALASRTQDELRETQHELSETRERLVAARDGAGDDGDAAPSIDGLVGRSELMAQVAAVVTRIRPTTLPVLITGESGTGKELVARAIHDGSARSRGPFVAENCAALPETLLESALFGHRRGAFTGADADREGLFAQARDGSLFLDEVGELSPEVQAKLLRVLESGEFRVIGGRRTERSNARVITATNRDLPSLVAAGRFREDLFYRLAVANVSLPPLRERRDDVPLLVEHFLEQARARDGRAWSIGRPALRLLEQASWPGNVRELRNTIDRAFTLTGKKDAIGVSAIRQAMAEAPSAAVIPDARAATGSGSGAAPASAALESILSTRWRRAKDEFARVYVEHLLRETGGNVTAAAKRAGMGRSSLQQLMQRLGIRSVDFG